jgi:hypothetical protein
MTYTAFASGQNVSTCGLFGCREVLAVERFMPELPFRYYDMDQPYRMAVPDRRFVFRGVTCMKSAQNGRMIAPNQETTRFMPLLHASENNRIQSTSSQAGLRGSLNLTFTRWICCYEGVADVKFAPNRSGQGIGPGFRAFCVLR